MEESTQGLECTRRYAPPPHAQYKIFPTIRNILKGWEVASSSLSFNHVGSSLLIELTIPQLVSLIAKSRGESPSLYGDAISSLPIYRYIDLGI